MKHHLADLEARATALKNSGRNTEAAKLFAQIVNEQPDWEHGTAFHLLAQCYEDSGQLELAEENYRAALRYEPENDIFLGGVASFLYQHGKPEDAFSAYIEVLDVYKSTGNAEGTASCMIALEALGERFGWNRAAIAAKIEESRPKQGH